ncbi:type II toxin-antitoxin system PemK/MazF family toxin [Kamptonema formosum]|nr:type II toxin-antitoxin system PemK/MazF family toxin [Oscillatoria sp. PCC 10802]
MSVHRGQIYFVNLDPVPGRERAGTRPVLVLSIDRINRYAHRHPPPPPLL